MGDKEDGADRDKVDRDEVDCCVIKQCAETNNSAYLVRGYLEVGGGGGHMVIGVR